MDAFEKGLKSSGKPSDPAGGWRRRAHGCPVENPSRICMVRHDSLARTPSNGALRHGPKSPVPLARPGRHGRSEVLPPGRSATDATAGLPLRAGLATRRARRGTDRRPTPRPLRRTVTPETLIHRQALASRDGRMPVPERAAEGAGLETTTRLVRASLDRVARGCPNRGSRTRSGVDPTTSGFSLDPLRTTVLGSRSASGSCFQRRTSERATHGATGPQGWARRYPFFLSLQHGDF